MGTDCTSTDGLVAPWWDRWCEIGVDTAIKVRFQKHDLHSAHCSSVMRESEVL